MDIGQVKAQIKSGKFDKWYIFTGEEDKILKIYIDKIAEVGKYKLVYSDSLSSVFAKLSQKSLLKSKTLYVIVDDKEFMSDEKLWPVLDNKIIDDIVIFHYTTYDKRIKFWKINQNRAVVFDILNDRLLTKYIQKELDLNERHCRQLIDACEGSYGRLLQEIDKIKLYADINDISDNTSQDTLIDDGTIYMPVNNEIYEFSDAVLSRNPKLVYKTLERIDKISLSLVSLLYMNFRNVLQVQTCVSDDIEKSTGLSIGQIKASYNYVDKYTDDELISILKLLRDTEKKLKFGDITDEVGIHYCLVNILR